MGTPLVALLLVGLDVRENFQEDILAEQRRLTRGSHHRIHHHLQRRTTINNRTATIDVRTI
jgi:hypothetical protein